MSHEKWDDNKIEQLLSNSPKIQDQRSKDDVFQRLKNDGLFDEMPSEKTKKESNLNLNGCLLLFQSLRSCCFAS